MIPPIVLPLTRGHRKTSHSATPAASRWPRQPHVCSSDVSDISPRLHVSHWPKRVTLGVLRLPRTWWRRPNSCCSRTSVARVRHWLDHRTEVVMAQNPNLPQNVPTDDDDLVVPFAAGTDRVPGPDSCPCRPPWRRRDRLARLVGWHCFDCWRHERQPDEGAKHRPAGKAV